MKQFTDPDLDEKIFAHASKQGFNPPVLVEHQKKHHNLFFKMHSYRAACLNSENPAVVAATEIVRCYSGHSGWEMAWEATKKLHWKAINSLVWLVSK